MNKQRIDEILNEDTNDKDDESKATSLRGKALLHTDKEYVPKTMTPYEWLEYYDEHGVPESHQHPDLENRSQKKSPRKSWWKRLLGLN